MSRDKGKARHRSNAGQGLPPEAECPDGKKIIILVYLAGGIAELTVMAILGKAKYLRILKRFSSDYIDKHERFERNKFLIPPYIRLRSYKHLGLIDGSINFIIPEKSS